MHERALARSRLRPETKKPRYIPPRLPTLCRSPRSEPQLHQHHEPRNPLVHAADERVDLVLAVTSLATLDVVQALLGHAAEGGRQLEGPEEVGASGEVGAAGVDLVDEILNADDALLAERLLNDAVVGEGDALLVHLAVPALVDELLHRLEVGVAEHDVGLNLPQHVDSRLVHAHEDTVVDLAQAEELHDLAGLGVHVVDTAKAHDEHDLSLGLDVEAALGASLALEANQVSLLRFRKRGKGGRDGQRRLDRGIFGAGESLTRARGEKGSGRDEGAPLPPRTRARKSRII